MEKIDDT